MSKHTPEPWFVEPADDWLDSEDRWLQYGRYLMSAGSDKRSDEHYYRIGEVSNVNDSPKNEANARLIAAAPRLLTTGMAVCEAWDRYWSGGRSEADAVEFVKAISAQREVLAAATGESA